MRKYASTTSVPVHRSRSEIDSLLREWGAEGIRWTDVFKDGVVSLAFVWTHNDAKYAATIKVQLETDEQLRAKAVDGRTRRFSQTKFSELQKHRGKSEHRLLLLWLKAAFNAVEAGIISAEVLFLPFLQGSDGQTVAEVALPRIHRLMTGSANRLLEV